MGKYDRYRSDIKRALRSGNILYAIKIHAQRECSGLHDARMYIESIKDRYAPKPKTIRSICAVCQYQNENFYRGKCPRCESYYITSDTTSNQCQCPPTLDLYS